MEKLFYSVNEVAEIVGVEPHTIRYWEQEFPRFTPRRNGGKRRFYTPELVEMAKQIAYLRYDKKLSIEGVKKQLDAKQTDVERLQQATERLKNIRQQLIDIRNQL